MKTTKIKSFTFAALAALMTVLPVFAAEQNQSWWQQLWDGIWNYAQQNPKTAAAIGAAGTLGAYCTVKLFSQGIPLSKIMYDEQARKEAIDDFSNRIMCKLDEILKSPDNQTTLIDLKTELQSNAAMNDAMILTALQDQSIITGALLAADIVKRNKVERFLIDKYQSELLTAVINKLLTSWGIRPIASDALSKGEKLFEERAQKKLKLN